MIVARRFNYSIFTRCSRPRSPSCSSRGRYVIIMTMIRSLGWLSLVVFFLFGCASRPLVAPRVNEVETPPEGSNASSPVSEDRDTDGIVDAEDQCPDQPEDRDGEEDDDGCPDDPEDIDQYQDRRASAVPADHSRQKLTRHESRIRSPAAARLFQMRRRASRDQNPI